MKFLYVMGSVFFVCDAAHRGSHGVQHGGAEERVACYTRNRPAILFEQLQGPKRNFLVIL